MSIELFQVYDRPAIYERTDDSERCIAWDRDEGRFAEDPDALAMILSGSADVRRIDKVAARLLIARLLARHGVTEADAQAKLAELVRIENEAAQKRVPLTEDEKRRRSEIIDEVLRTRMLSRADGPGMEWEKLISG